MICLQSSSFYVRSDGHPSPPSFWWNFAGHLGMRLEDLLHVRSLGTPTTYAQGLCVHVCFSQTIHHSLIPRLYGTVSFSDCMT